MKDKYVVIKCSLLGTYRTLDEAVEAMNDAQLDGAAIVFSRSLKTVTTKLQKNLQR